MRCRIDRANFSWREDWRIRHRLERRAATRAKNSSGVHAVTPRKTIERTPRVVS